MDRACSTHVKGEKSFNSLGGIPEERRRHRWEDSNEIYLERNKVIDCELVSFFSG
jgi:hypothetical protein